MNALNINYNLIKKIQNRICTWKMKNQFSILSTFNYGPFLFLQERTGFKYNSNII